MAQNVTLERTDVNAPREILHVDTGPDRAGPGRNAPEMAFVQPNPPPPQAPPPQAPPARPLPPPPPPQRPPQQQQQQQPQPEELSHFANQNKIEESPELADEFLDEDDGMEEDYGNGGNGQEEEEEYGHGGNGGGYYEPPSAPAPVRPLPPFETLEDERADLMFKLQRAARAGIQVRTFGYSADIRDMRSEVARAKAEQDVTASIAFQRQILMTLCSGIEFANRKFSYFDLELDGWAESMMDDMGKFDNIFEKLHQKHAGRMNIPPEMQLVLAIGGSAMTWHLVKTMTKGSGGKTKRQRPKQVQSSSSEDSSRRGPPPPPPKRTRDKPHPRRQQQPGPREMRGPGFDMGGMGDMMGPMMSMLPRLPIEGMPAPPMHSRGPNKKRTKSRITEIESSAAGSSSNDNDNNDNGNGNDGHSGHSGHSVSSERLSDIPSEFSADVPSEFSDVPLKTQARARNDDDVLDIDIPPPTKRKRGPYKKNAAGPPKTIVVI